MSAPNMVFGSKLSREDRETALARFTHRFTGEHRPSWAGKLRPDGTRYMPQFKDDADWLAHTEFHVTKSGKLVERYGANNRHDFVISHPTWPFGKDEAQRFA